MKTTLLLALLACALLLPFRAAAEPAGTTMRQTQSSFKAQQSIIGEKKKETIVVSIKLQNTQNTPVVGAFVAIDYNSGPRFRGEPTDNAGTTKIELPNPHYSVIVVKHEGKIWHFQGHKFGLKRDLELTLDDEHLFPSK